MRVYVDMCACIRMRRNLSYLLAVQSSILNKSYSCIFTRAKNFSVEVVVGNLTKLIFRTGLGLDLSVYVHRGVCASLP